MPITPKERELAAVGISVAAGCKPCTDFHVKKVRDVGASDSDIERAMSDAFAVRRGATEIMEAHALAHLGQAKPAARPEPMGEADRVREFVCIGAAFGVNCVSSLKAHLEAAERAGVSHEEITAIIKLSAFIKGKAASHVEHLAESLEKPETAYEKAVNACC